MKKIYDKNRVREALSGNEYQDLLESLEAEETFFWPAEGENTPEHF